MLLEGDLGKVARSTELLDVIATYGDRAAAFVWENKGALAVGTALVAFLADPEAYFTGAKERAQVAGETAARPIAEGVARGTNWTPVVLIALLVASGCGLFAAAKVGVVHAHRAHHEGAGNKSRPGGKNQQ